MSEAERTELITNTQTNRINNHFEKVLVALVFVVSLLAAPVPAHSSTTYTVDSVGDLADTNTGDGLCVASNGTCTLRAAIQQADAAPGGAP